MFYAGFKGAGDAPESGQPKPGLVALNLNWWWDWTFFGNGAPPQAQPYWGPWMNHGSVGPYPGLNQSYAPMLWCPTAEDAIYDELVRTEARSHPGGAWFLFNEPDSWAQCGALLGRSTVARAKETARRYVYYWELVKAADQYAKVFCCGNYYLPMPGLGDTLNVGSLVVGATAGSGGRGFPPPKPAGIPPDATPSDGRVFWETFILYADLANHPLDGLHIHVYPGELGTQHAGCPVAWPEWHDGSLNDVHFWAEWWCAQEALQSAYTWFQTQAGLANRPIWIAETGSLDYKNLLQQAYILGHNMDPMQSWLNANTQSNGTFRWINAVAWYTTYCTGFLPTNLLATNKQQFSTLGQDWATWSCLGCEFPR